MLAAIGINDFIEQHGPCHTRMLREARHGDSDQHQHGGQRHHTEIGQLNVSAARTLTRLV